MRIRGLIKLLLFLLQLVKSVLNALGSVFIQRFKNPGWKGFDNQIKYYEMQGQARK